MHAHRYMHEACMWMEVCRSFVCMPQGTSCRKSINLFVSRTKCGRQINCCFFLDILLDAFSYPIIGLWVTGYNLIFTIWPLIMFRNNFISVKKLFCLFSTLFIKWIVYFGWSSTKQIICGLKISLNYFKRQTWKKMPSCGSSLNYLMMITQKRGNLS